MHPRSRLENGTDEVERLEKAPISKGQAKQGYQCDQDDPMASNFAAQASQNTILLDAFFVSKYAFDAAQRG